MVVYAAETTSFQTRIEVGCQLNWRTVRIRLVVCRIHRVGSSVEIQDTNLIVHGNSEDHRC